MRLAYLPIIHLGNNRPIVVCIYANPVEVSESCHSATFQLQKGPPGRGRVKVRPTSGRGRVVRCLVENLLIEDHQMPGRDLLSEALDHSRFTSTIHESIELLGRSRLQTTAF